MKVESLYCAMMALPVVWAISKALWKKTDKMENIVCTSVDIVEDTTQKKLDKIKIKINKKSK